MLEPQPPKSLVKESMTHHRPCPRCGNEVALVGREYGEERVDFCVYCHGVYFDKGELEGLIELMSDFNSVKLDEPELANQPPVEENFNPPCPGCQKIMKTDQVGTAWINQCLTCEGIWLDQGELTAIRGAQLIIRENLNLFLRLSQ
jgi:Zn-finger nucleic acid-binding protein